jgi:diguanylate cyclase (GGDEF)-like protein
MSLPLCDIPAWNEEYVCFITLPFKSLDDKTTTSFKNLIDNKLNDNTKKYMIIDFSTVETIEHPGIINIFYLWRCCSKNNITLILCSLNNNIHDKIKSHRLDSFFNIVKTPEEALNQINYISDVNQKASKNARNLETYFGNLVSSNNILQNNHTKIITENNIPPVPLKLTPPPEAGARSNIYNLTFNKNNVKKTYSTKIVIIDEDQIIRNQIKKLLAGQPFCLYEFDNAAEALKHIENNGTDIVISETITQQINGVCVCLAIRNRYKNVFFFFLSNDCTNSTRHLAYKANAHDYLTKPFNEEEVLTKLNTLHSIISNLKSLYYKNSRLQKLALTDPLTELNNRRYFQIQITKELNRAERYNNTLALLLVDIDHFKRINDTYGHLTGDEILKRVSSLLTNTVRKSDIVCRIGGEEFAIILPETDSEKAFLVAEKIRIAFEKTTFIFSNFKLDITSSIGIALKTTEMSIDHTDFLDMADKAMYLAKNEGRNRTIIYNLKKLYTYPHTAKS